ncbi:D-glycero-beta-D-manno-heptose 1-phosphate adenylyltransferase [candidate division KSB1 bacterium]|nr:D-glycero-beta-D-manno-heptose 1-phosphate adenylyltransferase [candidate division KSB1 bacterium]
MSDKIKTVSELQHIRSSARISKKRVVWTNGCYDILHAGHVLYLQRAKECGDILIVGLNSDNSIRATKGQLRPIVPEAERAIVISALACVDHVIIFDQDSPIEIIATLQPDIYAKGGDYTIETINQAERRMVESYGGEIALLPGIAGNSTTAVINKILRAYRDEHQP